MESGRRENCQKFYLKLLEAKEMCCIVGTYILAIFHFIRQITYCIQRVIICCNYYTYYYLLLFFVIVLG